MTAAVSWTLAVILSYSWIKSREETLLLRAVVDVVAAAVAAVAAATPIQFLLLLLLLLLPLLQPITHKALTPAPDRTVVRHACRYTVLL